MVLSVLLIFASSLNAQEQSTVNVSGIVEDEKTHNPLQGVSVSLNGDQGREPVSTDINGAFTLRLSSNVKAGSAITVYFQKKGYQSSPYLMTAASEPIAQIIKMRRIAGTTPSKPGGATSVPPNKAPALNDDVDRGKATAAEAPGSSREIHKTTDGVEVTAQHHEPEDTATGIATRSSFRAISRDDRQTIVGILSLHPQVADISGSLSSTESLRFAQDLFDTLRLAGWKVSGVNQVLTDPPFTGIKVKMFGIIESKPGMDTTPEKDSPEWVLCAILIKYGPVSVHTSPTQARGTFELSVGMMPEN